LKIILLILSLIFTLNANGLEKVKLQLKWKTQFQFAGFISAIEKGFYRDEGIEVELLEYNNKTNTLLDLEQGKTSFAVSDSSVILETAKGKKLVGLMAIYQKSPYILMSLKSSNITTFSQINNKKVALYNDMNGNALESALKINGINIQKVNITDKIKQLQNKEVDLVVGYISNEPYLAKNKGIELNVINLQDYGLNRYGDILFTLEKTLKNRPKLVAKMYRATKKGFKYAFSNIDEMVDIIYHKYNTQKKSKEAYYYEANILKNLLGDMKNFGNLNPSKIDSIAYTYSYSNSIKYHKINLKNFIYKSAKSKIIHLTKEEQEYLDNKETISMCYYVNVPPYTMMKNGKPIGESVDYYKRVEKIIGKKFKLVYAYSIKEQFTLAYNKKCITMPIIQTSPQTVPFMKSTISAGKDNLVLVTKINEPYLFNMDKLHNKKVAINRDYIHLMEYLDNNHPKIKYVKVKGNGLKEVASGELFGAIGASIIMNYSLTQKYKDTLKVMTDYPNSNIEGSIAVRSDEPILLSILNKAMATMDRVTQDEIFEKWIDVKYKEVINYTLVWQILFISFLILSIVIYANRRLKSEIDKRKYAEATLQQVNSSLEDRVNEAIKEIHSKETLLQNQSRLAQMGEMIAMIAHQWRQPLSSINSAIVNIEVKQNFQYHKFDDKKVRDKFLEYNNKKLNQIEGYVSFLSKTIDDFRNFFNIDKEKKTSNINKTIEMALNIIETSFTIKNINICKKLNDNIELEIYENEIIQVILNIFINAKDNFEHKNIKNPQIMIETIIEENKLTISIYDNGGGIDKGTIKKIFNPYFSTKDIQNGTGLGLYMSKTIIEEHHRGKLNVNNTLNGVRFDIVLPI